jgi:LysM repeat protein
MKLAGFARAVLAVGFLMIHIFSADAQVVVERSKEKVIISGVQYYIHPVKKGETAYSISKAYGISVAELTKDNPQASAGIIEGQSLRIQVKELPVPAPSEVAVVPRSHDDSKYLYHVLKPGETVYFLSKTYNVTENEIVKSNPGIDITKMSVGSEIAVPKKSENNENRKGDVQEKKYFLHKVAEGETLSSIAGKYGISAREIKRANRDVRIALVGDYIRIPGVSKEEPPVSEVVKPDTVRPVVVDTLPVYVAPAGRTEVKNLGGTINVALLLPFYLRENADRGSADTTKAINGNSSSSVNLREEDWIYPRSLDFIEMYEGILLAADTLRALGMNINLYSYDIKSDTFELTRLINSGKLSKMDLIIGPVYSHNLSIVAAYAGNLDIPVVSPVSLRNNSVLSGNPELFLANSTLEVSQQAMARKASEYYDRNFIFVHSDSTNSDEDVIRLKSMIMSELGYKIPRSEIKFKEVIFSGLSMFDNDSGSRIAQALSDKTENIVIIATEDAPVISKTIVDLHMLSRRFDIKVFGYSEISENDNLDPKLFFDLGLMLYSPSNIDYSTVNVAKFNSDFKAKFLTEPVEKSYAWQGYDIAYYFISGLAMHGREFIRDPSVHNPVLLQTEYNFLRRQPGDGFENQKQYLIRYTKDYEVNVAEEYPGNNHKSP